MIMIHDGWKLLILRLFKHIWTDTDQNGFDFSFWIRSHFYEISVFSIFCGTLCLMIWPRAKSKLVQSDKYVQFLNQNQ